MKWPTSDNGIPMQSPQKSRSKYANFDRERPMLLLCLDGPPRKGGWEKHLKRARSLSSAQRTGPLMRAIAPSKSGSNASQRVAWSCSRTPDDIALSVHVREMDRELLDFAPPARAERRNLDFDDANSII